MTKQPMKSCVGIMIFLIFISLIIKPLISALLDIFMTWDSKNLNFGYLNFCMGLE